MELGLKGRWGEEIIGERTCWSRDLMWLHLLDEGKTGAGMALRQDQAAASNGGWTFLSQVYPVRFHLRRKPGDIPDTIYRSRSGQLNEYIPETAILARPLSSVFLTVLSSS